MCVFVCAHVSLCAPHACRSQLRPEDSLGSLALELWATMELELKLCPLQEQLVLSLA